MVLWTTLFFHSPNLSLHFNLSRYALRTYWFWHFQFFHFFFLNVFYVNINILAKRILFGFECWCPCIYIDLIVDLIHMHIFLEPILVMKLPKVLLKLSNLIVSTSYGGLKFHLGDLWKVLVCHLWFCKSNKKHLKTNIGKIPCFIWFLF